MFNNSASLQQLQRQLMLLSSLLLFLAMGSGCCADGVGFNVPLQLREGKHKLCGQALNEAMDVVCVNGYNTIPKKRMDRNEATLELETAEQTQLQQPHGGIDGIGGFALSPLLSSIYGMEVLVKTRRLRRQGGGIYDECCRNSCTYPELLAYCRQ